MSQRLLSTIGLIAAALVLAVLIGIVGILYSRPVSAQSSGVTGLPQVTVIGEGTIKGTPDTATVQIGVETDATTVEDAISQNNTQAQAVIDKLKELGVAETAIQTSNFSVYPTYDNEGKQVTGYHVSNMVSVTISDLEKTGTLLDQVVQVGVNRIYGISFSVADPNTLLDQARDLAMQNAKARAEQLAKAGGTSIGSVLVITENIGSASPIPVMRTAEMAQGAAADVPVQAGEQSFTVQVQVTYELK